VAKVMYDSVDSESIFENAALVAGYVDGVYAWSDDAWARHPSAVKVRIAVFADTNDGDCLDCERGDALPEDCPGWIAMRQAAGVVVPTIYCSIATMPYIHELCDGLTFDVWVADWTGEPHIPDGAAACQYAAKGAYDVTLCSDTWPRA